VNRAAKILRKMDALIADLQELVYDIDGEVVPCDTLAGEAYGSLLITRDKAMQLRSRFKSGAIDDLLGDFLRDGAA